MVATSYRRCLEHVAARDGLPDCELRPVFYCETTAVEQALSAELPEAYRSFLSSVGCGNEFGGVGRWLHLDITRPGNIVEISTGLAGVDNRGRPRVLAVYDGCEGELFGFVAGRRGYRPGVYACDLETGERELVASDFPGFLDWLVAQQQRVVAA